MDDNKEIYWKVCFGYVQYLLFIQISNANQAPPLVAIVEAKMFESIKRVDARVATARGTHLQVFGSTFIVAMQTILHSHVQVAALQVQGDGQVAI